MAALPEGWEWDYDGQRWFYKYKPTGHIQYHFPKEGDEFPDFVDDASPAPVLAPEERLESQQQVKRQTSTSGSGRAGGSGGGAGHSAGWKSQMSATARPVSMAWEDEGDPSEDVFQPENFMYLGPGTYTDVSPLAEEEEEAARRVLAGGIEKRVDGTPSKGVSPVASERTTPHVANSHPVYNDFVMGDMTMGDPMMLGHFGIPPTVPEEPVVHMIDSREVQPQFNPIGVIAEMPTEATGFARVETNPPPIEMADNMVLAPIETAVPEGFAELPERSSPVEQKPGAQIQSPEETAALRDAIRQQQLRRQQEQQALKLQRRTTEGETGEYQPYKPGTSSAAKPPPGPNSSRDEAYRDKGKTSLQREQSLMMNTGTGASGPAHYPAIPVALAPRNQPFGKPSEPARDVDAGPVVTGPAPPPKIPPAQGGLGYVPSVLKVARTGSPQASQVPGGLQVQLLGNLGPAGENGQGLQQPGAGIAKVPSVLRAGRRGAPPQPGQQPQQSQTFPPNQGQHLGHTYVPPKQGLHPSSMTPSPLKQLQKQEENPHVGIQRVNTVPEQLPSQTLPLDQRPQQAVQQPLRPASVNPGMMMGGPQPDQQLPQQQAMNLPYNGRISGVSSTVPPQQAAPFAAPQMHPRRRSDTQPLGGEVPAPMGQSIRHQTMTPYPPDDPKPVRQNTAPYPPDDPKPVPQNTAPYPPDDPRPLARQSTAPYPPDDPRPIRQNTAPYPPDEPRPLRRQSTAPYPDDPVPGPPAGYNRRHSSVVSDMVSPLESRSGSISSGYPLQTPSPLDSGRRASSASLSQTISQGFTPSPLSSSQSPQPQPSRLPPGQQNDPSSYFPTQNMEGQGHAVSAQNKLRKKSLGRSDSAKRASLPPGQSPLSSQPTAGSGSLHRSQSLRETSQGHVAPQQQPLQPPFPPLQQESSPLGLTRIEEHEEAPGLTPSRSSSRSSAQARRSSQASIQQSPQGSRRQSLQMVPGTEVRVGSPAQGNVPAPGWNGSGRIPPQQMPPQGQFPPGQIPAQNQRPVHGQVLPQGQVVSGSMPPQRMPNTQGPPIQGQVHQQGSRPVSMQGAPTRQGQLPMQMPPRGQEPQGPAIQGQIPPSGRMPPGQIPPGQRIVQGQLPPQGQMPPQGHVRVSSQSQGPNGRIQPQVQIPQGQPWNPNVQSPMGHGPRPGSVPPPETPKEKKWLKWLKGGNKSNGPSPTTLHTASPASSTDNAPLGWGGSEYSQPVVWQPGMPVQSQQPPAAVVPPLQQRPGQIQPGLSDPIPAVAPLNVKPTSVPSSQPVPGQAPPAQIAPGPGPPNQNPLSQPPLKQAPLSQSPTQQAPGQAPLNGPGSAPLNQGLPPKATGFEPLIRSPSPVQVKQAPPPAKVSPLVEKVMMIPAKEPEPLQGQPPLPRIEPLAPLQKHPQPGRTPPPPEQSPVPSDLGPPSIGQMTPGMRDSFSDAGSATFEISEAQSQPVLRPHVVQVHRRSTDFHQGPSGTQTPVPAQPASQVTPLTLKNERPAPHDRTPSTFSLPSQQKNPRSEAVKQEDPERSLTPAPLFSGPNSPASSRSGVASPPALRSPRAKQFEPAPLAQKSPPSRPQPPVEDKWAKKPVVDYSGGDWGDDDDWDY